MKLPNGDAAIIDPRKLLDYCLDLNHTRGGDKANVFAAAVGVGRHNWMILRDALAEAAATQPAENRGPNVHEGTNYRIDFPLTGPTGTATVRSNWVVQPSGTRLTSCWVLS